MIQYEGEIVGINRRIEYNHPSNAILYEHVIKSTLEFKTDKNNCHSIEIEGRYDIGTKFLIDVYPIPAFKE